MDQEQPAIRPRWRRLLNAVQAVEGAVYEEAAAEDVIDAVAGALDALYDVVELVKKRGSFGNKTLEELVDGDEGGETALGLVWARGEKTHALVNFGDLHTFGSHGFGEGPFGGGWAWQRMDGDDRFRRRFGWYDSRVRGRRVEDPFPSAIAWLENRPEITPV